VPAARRSSARCSASNRLASCRATASSVSSKVRRLAPSARSSETSSAGATRSWSASTDLRSRSNRWRSWRSSARARSWSISCITSRSALAASVVDDTAGRPPARPQPSATPSWTSITSTPRLPCNHVPGSPVCGGHPTLGTQAAPWYAERERGNLRPRCQRRQQTSSTHLPQTSCAPKLSRLQCNSTRPPPPLAAPLPTRDLAIMDDAAPLPLLPTPIIRGQHCTEGAGSRAPEPLRGSGWPICCGERASRPPELGCRGHTYPISEEHASPW
jgi:hypothetical protein